MSQGRLVFLTGATGFIGSRLAQRLVARGDRIRCLVRRSSDTTDLERLGAELVVGELTDAKALERALEGVDLAYHLAGAYDIGVVDAAALERTNVEGTRAFLTAIEAAGVQRSVYVSTTAALLPIAEGEGDETSEAPQGYRFPSVYQQTKAEAHRLARDAQARGVPLIIACPAAVYGPGDTSPSARFMAELLAGRIPGLPVPTGWLSYVHVDDVVEGLVLAGEKGPTGEVYVLSGEHASIIDFARRVRELAGMRPVRLRFPVPLVWLTALLLDGVTHLTGWRSSINRENLALTAGKRWLHSHAKATRVLGWTPRPLAEGLQETVAWFLEEQRSHRNR